MWLKPQSLEFNNHLKQEISEINRFKTTIDVTLKIVSKYRLTVVQVFGGVCFGIVGVQGGGPVVAGHLKIKVVGLFKPHTSRDVPRVI